MSQFLPHIRPRPDVLVDTVIDQLVSVIRTLRNNTMHGGNEIVNPVANDVLTHAYDLLRMIVDSFLIR